AFGGGHGGRLPVAQVQSGQRHDKGHAQHGHKPHGRVRARARRGHGRRGGPAFHGGLGGGRGALGQQAVGVGRLFGRLVIVVAGFAGGGGLSRGLGGRGFAVGPGAARQLHPALTNGKQRGLGARGHADF